VKWGDVEAHWKITFLKELLRVKNTAGATSSDIREALAFESLDERLWTARISWQSAVESLEAYTATLSTALNARQSLLRATRDSSEPEARPGDFQTRPIGSRRPSS
jgi:hypothetical protein